MLTLLTSEKQKLAFFIEQSRQTQEAIYAEALACPHTSNPLLLAYTLILENIR
jgi:hypothetical protein